MLIVDSRFGLHTSSKSVVAQTMANRPAQMEDLLAVARRAFIDIQCAKWSRRILCATEPARPTRWAATSYWSTRNRRPPTGLAWLDAVGMRGKSFAQWQIGAGVDANDAADLGSDPHSASQTKIRLLNIPEWGSDPNSAAHNTKTTTQKRPSNSASPITGHRQPTGQIGLLGSLFRPAGRERAGGVSGEKSI